MELQPDAAALKEDETAQMILTIKKVGADAWGGLPGYEAEGDTVNTRTLFDHVVEQMEGENDILVAHGKDPRR
eukprot:5323346-Prymnesium_polylepis.1